MKYEFNGILWNAYLMVFYKIFYAPQWHQYGSKVVDQLFNSNSWSGKINTFISIAQENKFVIISNWKEYDCTDNILFGVKRNSVQFNLKNF